MVAEMDNRVTALSDAMHEELVTQVADIDAHREIRSESKISSAHSMTALHQCSTRGRTKQACGSGDQNVAFHLAGWRRGVGASVVMSLREKCLVRASMMPSPAKDSTRNPTHHTDLCISC